MADLRLEHIYKVYPNGVKAVNDFTMDIKDKEFIVFVGPSGCGKSTTLRMIAGLEEITAGELYIGDQIVNDMEPKDRDIAMVFQNYALYPHMTVYENMAFGLKLRHLPADEIHEKVLWAADVLGLKEYLDRKPKAMSGGQRQRVSLGRAILRNPKVMLLDEPLSNLDAKLRSQMRSEISKLHQKLATTFIYVTHDQVEAMTLGTRVVVMKLGRIQQIDAPKNLYDYPINKFVAGFIGTPQMNFFEAKLVRNGDKVTVDFENSDAKVEVPFIDLLKIKSSYLTGDKVVTVGLRCEDISIEEEDIKNATNLIDVKVSHFEELGNETLIYGDINMAGDGFEETTTRVILKASSRHGLVPGDVVKATFNMNKAHFFDKDTEVTIKPRIPEDNLATVKLADGKLAIYGQTLDLPKAVADTNYEGDVVIPNEAYIIGEKGLKGKCVRVEQVKDKYVNYVESNDVVFFITLDKPLDLNKNIDFTLDFSKINFGDSTEMLPEADEFVAHFDNIASVINKTSNAEYIDIRNNKTLETNKKYDDLANEIKEKYDAEIASINPDERVGAIAETKERVEAEIAKINENLAAIKAENTKKLADASAEHKENLKTIKADVKDEYARRLAEENKDYKFILSTNSDKDVIFERKQEHRVFKENFPNERANELENKIASENVEYGAIKSAARMEIKRNSKQARFEIKKLKKELAREENLAKYLAKEEAKALSDNEKARKKALLDNDLIFFFKYNLSKDYVLAPSEIANKLIQGLGTKVFSKAYIIRVPHDGYVIADENTGILKGKVLSVEDYGVKKFIKVHPYAEGDEIINDIYIETKDNATVGDDIYFNIDLIKTQIIENGLKIRLY